MPIYEFRCTECGNEFETLLLRRSDRAVCEQCGSEALERMLSAHAVGSSGSAADAAPCGDGGCASGMCGGGACALDA